MRGAFEIYLFSNRANLHLPMVPPIATEPKIKPPLWAVEFLVGAAGFEPTLAESESDVLPLNYAPICALL